MAETDSRKTPKKPDPLSGMGAGNPFGANGGMGGLGSLLQMFSQLFSALFGNLGSFGNFLKDTGSSLGKGVERAIERGSQIVKQGGQAIGKGWNSLLDFIGHYESRGDYNIAAGGKRANFTDMSLNEVLAWQKSYVAKGAESSAVGKYQIIQGTLRGAMKEMGLKGDEKFDPQMQDRIAMHLLQKRGLGQFQRGEISEREFQRRLSQEWASLPKDESGTSYYAGVGSNKALVSHAETRAAIRTAKAPDQQPSANDTIRVAKVDVKERKGLDGTESISGKQKNAAVATTPAAPEVQTIAAAPAEKQKRPLEYAMGSMTPSFF